MKPRLLVIGAGGHARVIIALVRRTASWEIAGVLDRTLPASPELIDDVVVVGTLDMAADFFQNGVHHAVLAVGDNAARAALYDRFSKVGFAFPILRHPTSLVEDNVRLGEGSVICAGAIIGAQVVIGRNVIVNSGAILDHETEVGDHAHIAPGCRVAGRVTIGEGAMLGIGTCVRDRIRIGAYSLVGAGSVVVDDIPAGVVAYGNPARVARARTP